MNQNKFRVGLLLFCFCWLPPSIAADVLEEVEGAGLMIRSVPSGAKVYIDGIERGLTPLNLPSMREGVYNVSLKKDGYIDRYFKARVRQDSRLVVSIDLEEAQGQVLVTIRRSPGSPPETALPLRPNIFIDGASALGPLLSLPVGYRSIRVRAFGWEDAAKTVYVIAGEYRPLEFNLVPAAFRLSGAGARRTRFNPANSGALGSTELFFEVSAPGRGRVTILDNAGNTVYFRELRVFESWAQGIPWTGRSWNGQILPDGNYRAMIEAESIPWDGSAPLIRQVEIPVVIDSSVRIQPLSLSSGKAGLLFAPSPEPLPPGAFQIEGNLLFGKVPGAAAWQSLPFAVALRFSPVEQFEITGALNISPKFHDDAAAAVGASVKWRFLEARKHLPLDIAAALSYGWNAQGSLSPFGINTGVEIFLPLSWRLNLGGGQYPALSLLLCPALLWTGTQGYPSEASPRALLSGGLFFQHAFITAGLSLRTEYRFDGAAFRFSSPESSGSWFGPLCIGGEIRIFPPPSNFVFSLLGGFWLEGSQTGGFGGLGIGLIY